MKRVLASVGVVAAVAGAVPLLTATPAAAAGTLVGTATIRSAGGAANLQSGDSSTTFTLRPTSPECPGDSTNDGYRWQGYMVSAAINPANLVFGSAGPNTVGGPGPNTGTYATFMQPLYTTTGSPVVNQNTADKTPPGTTGPILTIPDMNLAVFAPGDIPAGVYNVGIACTLGPASATQMSSYWNVKMTVTTDAAGGPAQVHWENGTAPDAPTITGVTAGTTTATNGQASVAFTNPAANPALTDCVIEVGTTAGGSEFSAGLSGACTSPRVVTGLAYGTQYFFRVKSVNSVGTSADSNEASATPIRPAVTGLAATPSANQIDLDWADAALLGADSYAVAVCTLPATSPCTSASAGYSAGTSATTATSARSFSSLVAGQLYTFTVTYGAAGTSGASSVQGTPLSSSILIQDVTVGRPNGALVLTQLCGKWDLMSPESSQFGFPDGLPASPASASGTAPVVGSGPGTDPEFGEYPYPENADGTPNASYPTHCGIALGNAHLVSRGGSANGAGQFFAASGRLNQVTIVDTRDTDPGWTINFTMSNLTSGANSISGNQLGWTAQRTDTPAFQDGFGNSYDQVVNYVNQSLAPNSQGAAGAGTAHAVIQAPDATPGLGIATLDARIKLLIPIHAKNGNYAGTLTINAL